MVKQYRINVEASGVPTHVGIIKQANTNTIKFLMSVVDNGKLFDITGASNATITIRKPDGTLSNSNVTITSDKKIEYLLQPNALNQVGVYEAEVQIFATGDIMLVTASMYYQVIEALANDSGVTTQPEYPILVTLISDVTALQTTVTAAEGARSTAESARAANELTRQQFQLKGPYNGATAYLVNNIVSYNGSSYSCIANSTGNLPTNASYWVLIASKGDEGVQGIKGDKGDTGTKGDTGLTGLQGDKGDKGDKGDTGLPGTSELFDPTTVPCYRIKWSNSNARYELLDSDGVLMVNKPPENSRGIFALIKRYPYFYETDSIHTADGSTLMLSIMTGEAYTQGVNYHYEGTYFCVVQGDEIITLAASEVIKKYSLQLLGDLLLTNLSNGDAITYDASLYTWKNKKIGPVDQTRMYVAEYNFAMSDIYYCAYYLLYYYNSVGTKVACNLTDIPSGERVVMQVIGDPANYKGLDSFSIIAGNDAMGAPVLVSARIPGETFKYFKSITKNAVYIMERQELGYNDNAFIVRATLYEEPLIDHIYFNSTTTLPAKITTMDSVSSGLTAQIGAITPGGTATAITLSCLGATLASGRKLSFIASANNNGAGTTVNLNGLGAKNLYLPGGTTAPTLITGNMYDIWYNGTSFFCKVSASGNAVAADILAGKTATTTLGPITGTLVIPTGTGADDGVGDNVIATLEAASVTNTTTSYLLAGKRFKTLRTGNIRIRYKFRSSDSFTNVMMCVQKNGSIVHEVTTSTTSIEESYVDLPVSVNDIMSVHIKTTSAGVTSRIDNIRVCVGAAVPTFEVIT